MAKVKVQVHGDVHYVIFTCPCGDRHWIPFEGQDFKWNFNGDVNKPTLRPSLLTRWIGRRDPDNQEEPIQEHVCHVFITDGNVQFLPDCTHDKANSIVPLPEID